MTSSSGKETIRASTDYYSEANEIFAAVEQEREDFMNELRASTAASLSTTVSTNPSASVPLVRPSLRPSGPIKRRFVSNFAAYLRGYDLRGFLLAAGTTVSCVIYPGNMAGVKNIAIVEFRDAYAVDVAIARWNGKIIPGITDTAATQGLELRRYAGPTGIIAPPPHQQILVLLPPPPWVPRLFVENLRCNVDPSRVREAFEDIGNIVYFHMHEGRDRQVLGTAILEYEYRAAAVQALILNGATAGNLIANGKAIIITPVHSLYTVPPHITASQQRPR